MDAPPTFAPTAYGNFDSSQWSNPYSLYQNQALPWPSSYTGWPTDAMGNPIKASPGMTLNSAPAAQQPQAQPQGANTFAQTMAGQMGLTQGNGANLVNFLGGLSSGGAVPNWTGGASPNATQALSQGNLPQGIATLMGGGGGGGQAGAAAAGASPGGGLDAQSYLSLLANPGKVTTPGATIPQGAPYQPGPGVLGEFLKTWQPASSGPGSQFQQGFAKALKGGR